MPTSNTRRLDRDPPATAASLESYDFELPPNLIAERPADPRDSARLLVVGPRIQDSAVHSLPDLLRPDDVLVFNDTRVIPAQLTGLRGRTRIHLTLHAADGSDQWRAFARPAKKLRVGDRIDFGTDFFADVVSKDEGGEVAVRFANDPGHFRAQLDVYGRMPLPPYIKRPADERDLRDYQTIYAKHEGAVAAPTAGLHFTTRLLDAVAGTGATMVNLTLHVGAGTFLPIRVKDIRAHRMHAERGHVSANAADKINRVRDAGGRIVAVGTTSLRLLESAADEQGRIQPFDDWTNIFICPGYRFRTADLLLTNFHLPKSTLFILVSAFAGLERMQAAYAHAIESRYRFFSFGDACLLHRAIM
ncbi:MAG: tRNA preQ1(34) S-adenosylmethionine ribosyltransferase-isomerase QueA [Alphaproteobacteria bacterium]|nr:tRNA preQ1(34) S-adenosylmethionine ribosyltransferase-isomerase QueA [Alphaproteobacteria bacterium]